MKKLIGLVVLSTLFTSCVMDYPQEPPPQRDRYGTYQDDRYDPRYDRNYRQGDARRSARERVLAGTYGRTPQVTERPAPLNQVKEDQGWVDPNRAIARKYPLGTTGYQEIEAMVRAQLSQSGGLSYLKNSNSILVLDYPANHAKVKQLMGAVVRDAVNIRVDVEFAAAKGMRDYGITVHHGGISVDNDGIHLPKRADINIRGQQANQNTNTRQFLTAVSGSSARLWVTKTAVDRQLLNAYRFIPFTPIGGIANVVSVPFPVPTVRDVGTSLWMRPVYTDDGLVIIELFPVLTTEINGRTQSFRVEKVQTKVVARPGQRVFLGGMNKQTSNFFASIFQPIGAGKGSFTDVVNIYVTPSVRKVGPRR